MIALLFPLLAGPTVEGATVPPGLECLARWYGGETVPGEGSWGLRVGGRVFGWDDQPERAFAETLEAPDLRDTLRLRYPTGEIVPVTRRDQDPGRVRHQGLLGLIYGKEPGAVKRAVVDFFGTRMQVHRRVEGPLRRVIGRLEAAVERDPGLRKFLHPIGGGYNWRVIAGTERLSPHSFGIAIDLNVKRSHYWRWTKGPHKWNNAIPAAIVEGFEAEGFIWGGRWYHYDTMHFEYRPELLDPECVP